MDTRAREPRSLVTWPTRVRRGVGVCDRRRASTASSGSSSVDGVFRFATRGSYAVSVYSAMADSVEYKLRYAVSSPLPGTMVRSWFKNDRLKREFIVPPSAGVAWPRGRRVQRQNAERAVAPGARARCGPTPFGVACGRKARPALRVMGRYRDRAGESAKWNGAIAWIPRIRMLSAGRLRGPGGPGALYFCGRAAPARGAHPDRGPPPAKTSNCRAGLPAWCLSPRGSRCSCSDRPLSRLGDWDTDSRGQARPAAADTLRRPTCTRHRLKRGKWLGV